MFELLFRAFQFGIFLDFKIIIILLFNSFAIYNFSTFNTTVPQNLQA